jgi:hypothetical protein
MGRQGPSIGELGGLPEKNKFLTLSVYDFKLKKNPQKTTSLFIYRFFVDLFF